MVGGGSTVYIDTFVSLAILCFLMDYLLLWATCKVTGIVRKSTRIAGGALIGTLYFALYMAADSGLVRAPQFLQTWPAIVLVSAAMLYTALSPLPLKQLLRAGVFYYFIAISAGGAGLAASYTLGWSVPLQLITAAAAIVIIAETGWGVVQRSLWQRLYHLPIEITLLGKTVRTVALLDTGNRLRDPMSGGTVIIVELNVLGTLIPVSIRQSLQSMSQGDLTGISDLVSSDVWSSRFRVIPFSSLGKKNGMLVGFRPDEVTVYFDDERIYVKNVTIGVYDASLDIRGTYHALLHPEILGTINSLQPAGKSSRAASTT